MTSNAIHRSRSVLAAGETGSATAAAGGAAAAAAAGGVLHGDGGGRLHPALGRLQQRGGRHGHPGRSKRDAGGPGCRAGRIPSSVHSSDGLGMPAVWGPW